MGPIFLLPSLLCGLALCVQDLRCRRVPRLWVGSGSAIQALCNLFLSLTHDLPWFVMTTLLFASAAGVIQFLLALARPGAMGMGDVTASFMVGQAVGSYGLGAFVLWWLAMGLMGLLWMGIWLWMIPSLFQGGSDKEAKQKIPFVPVIVFSGLSSVLLCL